MTEHGRSSWRQWSIGGRNGWGQRGLALLLMVAAQASAGATLTLAIADLPSFAPMLIAEANGEFAAAGLDLKVIHCVNGKRCLQHLLDGEAHFATVADTPIVLASFTRQDFAVVATFTSSTAENQIVARADRGIRQPGDLRGKRVGVVKGTSGHYFTDRYLLFHGLDAPEVTLVPVDAADPAGALARGEVDAVGSYHPMAFRARQLMGREAVFLPKVTFFNATFNLVVRQAGTGVSDEDITKILRALRRAEESILAQPQQSRAQIAKRLNMDPTLLDAIWPDYRFALSLEQSLLTTFEGQARWAKREKLDQGRPAPNFLNMVRTGPLKALEPRVVTLVK